MLQVTLLIVDDILELVRTCHTRFRIPHLFHRVSIRLSKTALSVKDVSLFFFENEFELTI